MKNKKAFIILCIFVIILVGVIVFSLLKKPDTNDGPQSNNDQECLKKGNVCSEDEIKKGILVNVMVNDKKDYNFYVIDNTETNMTLLMDKNIASNVDWHSESINMKGPLEALMQIYENTKKWTNIKPIEDYVYNDYGKIYSEEMCKKGTTANYSCEYTGFTTRGYDKIYFSKDEKYVDFNLASEDGEEVLEKYDLMDLDLRARLITAEEYRKLENAKWLINNLETDKGYWTLTSSTAVNTHYAIGAYAVVNSEGNVALESLFVKNSLNKQYSMGIRPVITIEKR
ncbi:MAG: hypothetical protein E7167_04165 [Firmicutes bacterium]|nr:hypothetical protein [Bacillota bacterium]